MLVFHRCPSCRHELAKLRAHKRAELLTSTEKSLREIQAGVEAGRLRGAETIGVRVGKVINRHKMAKHFVRDIADTRFTFARKDEAIAAEAALDGIYIIRTSVAAARMDAARLRAQLQDTGQRRARLPQFEDDGSEGAVDPPSHGGSRACAHSAVHAGLLRRMAHA